MNLVEDKQTAYMQGTNKSMIRDKETGWNDA